MFTFYIKVPIEESTDPYHMGVVLVLYALTSGVGITQNAVNEGHIGSQVGA